MFCVPTNVIYNFTLYLTLAEFITRALTKRLVSSYLWFSSYIKWIDMHMCTLYVCYMLHCEYTMYCILDISFTFWKQWRNVSQGTGQPAPQRDPLQDTRDLPKLGLHIRWQWGTTSSSCMWLASHKVTPPFSLLFYWSPHPHQPGLWSASLSLRPSPQCWARHAGPTLAGFLEAPMARLHRVTSACFAKNRTRFLLT